MFLWKDLIESKLSFYIFSFLRFYKSKIQIRNAITKQTEDTIAVEVKRYHEVVLEGIEKEISGLLIKTESE